MAVNPLERVPAVAVCPQIRCYARQGSALGSLCGAPARWRRPGRLWFEDAFFCDAHRSESDLAIAGDVVVRRVRLSVDVLMTGASMTAPEAQIEAGRQLERAVESIGGRLEVTGVHSQPVRYPAAFRAQEENGRGAGG